MLLLFFMNKDLPNEETVLSSPRPTVYCTDVLNEKECEAI